MDWYSAAHGIADLLVALDETLVEKLDQGVKHRKPRLSGCNRAEGYPSVKGVGRYLAQFTTSNQKVCQWSSPVFPDTYSVIA